MGGAMLNDTVLSNDTPISKNSLEDRQTPRLLDQVRNVIRYKHYSIRTERSYSDWIKRYIYFHNKQHPKDMNERHICAFLTYLAVDKQVASSTQNQALCALVFLYRQVLKKEVGDFDNMVRAKMPSKLPVVFTREEVKQVLVQLEGVNWLMGQVLYGSGLKVMECMRLRVNPIVA